MALPAMGGQSGAGVARLRNILAACGGAPALRAAPGSSSLSVCLSVWRPAIASAFDPLADPASLPREVAAEAARIDEDWSMR